MKVILSEATIDYALDGDVRIRGEIVPARVTRRGSFVVNVAKADQEEFREFLRNLTKKEGWHSKKFDIEITAWHAPKTYDQVKTIWGLLRVMSWVLYEEFGHEDTLYQDMLDVAGPQETSKLTGKSRPKYGLSKMSTVEAAICINWLINRLLEQGELVTKPSDLKKWWQDWSRWRFAENKEDPLDNVWKDVDDYRHNVQHCEACMKYLDCEQEGYNGQMAHIASKGATGIDELWNFLHLCYDCHILTQHEKGWLELLSRHPHLTPRVQKARERAGVGPLIDPASGQPKLLGGEAD